MPNTEAKILADTFQKVRDLTRWYFSLLKEADPNHTWEINGTRLNSILWVASHVAWAENNLILEGTGGKGVEIDWLPHYNIRSTGAIHDAKHDMKAALNGLKLVHEKAMEHLLSLSDEAMEMENIAGIAFGKDKTNRILIQHAIRHEAMHTGHLSWLCKINGIKTI